MVLLPNWELFHTSLLPHNLKLGKNSSSLKNNTVVVIKMIQLFKSTANI